MSLANAERPHDLSSVKGQNKVIKILSNDLVNGTMKPAYLFTGVRGTGKTSVARIFAEAVNCEHPKADGSPCGKCASCQEIRSGTSIDVYELDAASNNSVENVRDILDRVMYKPVHKKKVYILDECHMLSNAASNALLKVLEEPPQDVIFILCTTEFHKVLPTIVSRCSRYEFERINVSTITEHLEELCNKYQVPYEVSGLELIAKAANGGMRDALSILDIFFSTGKVIATNVADTLGMAPNECVFSMLNAVGKGEPTAAVKIITDTTRRGGSLTYFIEDTFSILLDMIDFQNCGNAESISGSSEYRENIVQLAYTLKTERAFQIMEGLRAVYQSHGNEFMMVSTIVSLIYSECHEGTLEARVAALEMELKELKSSKVVSAIAPNEAPKIEGTANVTDSNSTEPVEDTTENNVETSNNGRTAPFTEEEPDFFSSASNSRLAKGEDVYPADSDETKGSSTKEFESSLPFSEETPDFFPSDLPVPPQPIADTPVAPDDAKRSLDVAAVPTNLSDANEINSSASNKTFEIPDGMSFEELTKLASQPEFHPDLSNDVNGKEESASLQPDNDNLSFSALGNDAFARLWT